MVRVIVILALIAGQAVGQETKPMSNNGFIKGNDLLSICKGGGERIFECRGYITGAMDMADIAGRNIHGWKSCVPAGVSQIQATEIVTNWIEKNPKERHFPAAYLVQRAIVDAFPCE